MIQIIIYKKIFHFHIKLGPLKKKLKSNDNIENFVPQSSLDHLLSCQLCKNRYDNSIHLPMIITAERCGNFACAKCISELNVYNGQFCCPLCKKNHIEPEYGVDNYPINKVVLELLKITPVKIDSAELKVRLNFNSLKYFDLILNKYSKAGVLRKIENGLELVSVDLENKNSKFENYRKYLRKYFKAELAVLNDIMDKKIEQVCDKLDQDELQNFNRLKSEKESFSQLFQTHVKFSKLNTPPTNTSQKFPNLTDFPNYMAHQNMLKKLEDLQESVGNFGTQTKQSKFLDFN